MKPGIFPIVAAAVAACLLATAALADQLERVVLQPIEHQPAALQVTDASGHMIRFSPADLEMLPTYAMVTLTPWRERPARFEGVLLSDLLRETGLYDSAAIRVTAENDYITTIPRAVWTSLPILIATRVDGAPHSRRERGPIQFVIDMDAHRSTDLAREEYMVWMASRLEAAD